ncbi:unnamed protein product [Dovyalis caffra]|uniref:Uncharacterized protein n=1 Tax=Dovyalis caffra TaxID=77055 RepID=A0AAV1S986_9ROSI|nr:unnamed protein product [Dovyalis caffra]
MRRISCHVKCLQPMRSNTGFSANNRIHASLPQNTKSKEFCSNLIPVLQKADNVQCGRVSCTLPVLPAVGRRSLPLSLFILLSFFFFSSFNYQEMGLLKNLFSFLMGLLYNCFNGLHGGAAGTIAKRVSIVADDLLVLVVEGSLLRGGENLTVVATEFSIKQTRKFFYASRATFKRMPAAK